MMLSNNRTLRSIAIDNYATPGIGDTGTANIAASLSFNTALHSFSLRSNRVGDIGANCLAAALCNNHTITDLALGANDISDEGTVLLARALERNNTLRRFDIDRNDIGDIGMERLSEALCKNESIRFMNLECNGIKNRGAIAFGKMLMLNRTMRFANFQGNHIGLDGHEAIINGLRKNDSITMLGMGYNLISYESGNYVGHNRRPNEEEFVMIRRTCNTLDQLEGRNRNLARQTRRIAPVVAAAKATSGQPDSFIATSILPIMQTMIMPLLENEYHQPYESEKKDVDTNKFMGSIFFKAVSQNKNGAEMQKTINTVPSTVSVIIAAHKVS